MARGVGMIFRPMRPEDGGDLLALQRECYPPELWDDAADLDWLDGQVAEQDSRVVGVALGKPVKGAYLLYSVEVLPAYQRRGLGRHLAATLCHGYPIVEAHAITPEGRLLCERLGLWATGKAVNICGHRAEVMRGSVPWP